MKVSTETPQTQAEAQRQVAHEVAAFFLIGTIVYLAGVAAFGG